MDSVDRFVAGYLIAVANIVHLHGEEIVALDVLRECGCSRADAEKCDFTEYDTVVLEALFDQLEGQPA